MQVLAWLEVIPFVIAAASAVAAITPTKKDDKAIAWARRWVNILALNIANARPAADEVKENDRISK